MGAYLSTPVTEKISVNRETKTLKYGASSMQGWRVAQEDAHNCCPDYDKETNSSLFAVYDGHGGSEVAAYAAANLPDFLKSLPSYKSGKLSQALEDAFLGFDERLTKAEVIKELKELAGMPSDDNKEDEEEDEEPGLLVQEATMPLEQLLEKYGGTASGKVRSLRKQDKYNSPVIKPKTVGDAKENIVKNESETTSNDPVKKSLEEEMINGVSENENNENKEKEQAQNVANSCTDSNIADCKDSIGKDTKTKDTIANGSDADGAMMPDSSTDTCKPKIESISGGSKVSVTSGGSKVDSVTSGGSKVDSVTSGGSKVDSVTSGGSKVDSVTSGGSKVDSVTSGESKVDSVTSGGSAVTSGSSCNNSEAVCSSSSAGNSSGSGSADVGSSSGSGSSSGGSCSAGGSSSSSAGPGCEAEGSEAGSLSKAESGGSSSEQSAEAGSSTGRTRKAPGPGLLADEEESTDDSEDSDVELDSDEDIDNLVELDSEDDSDDLEMEEDEDLEEDDDILGGREEPGSDSGTTAVLALLRGKDLHVANAGDSRCVLCRNGKAFDMSEDHKPEDDIEQARIMTAGGRVTPDGRVNGGLNLSRALGDHCYKRNEALPLRDQMITPLPDIKSVVLTDEDEFMVLACDGIWNVMTSQDVTNFVRERIQSGVDQLSVICEEMFDFCLAPDTNGDGTGCDNMTCMIIKFNFNSNDHQTASVKRQHSDCTDPETVKKPKTDT